MAHTNTIFYTNDWFDRKKSSLNMNIINSKIVTVKLDAVLGNCFYSVDIVQVFKNNISTY